MIKTSNKRKFSAFSLMEMMCAMTIFSLLGFSLYNMVDAVTKIESESLGMGNFKIKGYEILDKMEKEISSALTSEEYSFIKGEEIRTADDLADPEKKHTKKKQNQNGIPLYKS